MYQLINTRTGEVISEHFTRESAEIHLNKNLFVHGDHFCIRATFKERFPR
jgi:hypothetical protein